MNRRGVWTIGLAGILPALLLAHAGCAGQSVSHGGTGGDATEQSGGAGGGSGLGGTSWAGSPSGTGGTSWAGSPSSTGGTGTSPPTRVLDFSTIDCDPSLLNRGTSSGIAAADFLNVSCAKNFCHGAHFVVGLDLRPDEGFADRLLDAPALHGGIPCPDDILSECVPASCPAPGTVKIIDSDEPMASWILTSAHNEQGDCGGQMPDTKGLTPAQDACLVAIVNATAALK